MASPTYVPKNILITGAAGFIASHVANRLIRKYPHYKIVVLDKLDYCSNLKNLSPSKSSKNFKFVKGDIASADLVNYLLLTEGIDTIMHFAAQTHVDNSFGNSFEFTKNNIYGTHVLLEACKVTGQIKRFIHVSTDEVYGETEEDAIVGNHEASQLLPTNPYSATKAGAEMLVMAYGRSYGLPFITTRGNNVYGPNQFPEKLIPKFLLLAMQGKPLPIHGDGSNVRSYLYCEDVAEAFECVLHKGVVGHVYNIGTKKERRVIDVAKDICDLFNLDYKKQVKMVDNRPFNDQRYFLDDKKLIDLGWQERTSWTEGLQKTKDWYTSNPDWWGDVSGALVPHPRSLTMPGVEKLADMQGGMEVKVSNEATDIPKELSVSNGVGSGLMNGIVSKAAAPIRNVAQESSLKFLIYGRTGWLGGLLGKLCEKQGIAYEYGSGRLENRSQLEADIAAVKPTHVFNAAGVTGRPNVDWCESHKVETIRANVVGTLTLADVCKKNNLLLVNYATGCIFEYDEKHPLGSGIGFKEEDTPNFHGSYYSKTKAMVEDLLKEFDNVCTLRVRMPISSDLQNPRNFISKIVRYQKIVNIPNSMTILDELLPISIEMAKRNLRGIWNFTNPGVVSHNEIMEMYKKYIDPELAWVNFTLEEQAKVIVAARSNNEMDASKLAKEFPEMLSIKESLIKFVFEPNKKTEIEGKVIEKAVTAPTEVSTSNGLSNGLVNGMASRVVAPINNLVRDSSPKFLIYGRTGWIGGLLGNICKKQGIAYEYGSGRLENRSQLEADIATVRPTHVFNAAGVTGRPNVDWCEEHKVETIRANVVGTLTLADVCKQNNLLLVNYATGCIFEYDEKHPLGRGIGFKEEDTPNFHGSYYSKTKAMVEDLLKEFDNVCTLRVRMPISSDLQNPRNFITKIARYEKIVNIPNSMTILDELLPISIKMAKRNLRGIYNFTNPGVVSHNEIMEMYKKYIDPEKTWANFTLEEQAKVIVAARSNNEMDASKLWKEFPEMLPIKEALLKFVFEPNRKTPSM